jgi:hypothetical protein
MEFGRWRRREFEVGYGAAFLAIRNDLLLRDLLSTESNFCAAFDLLRILCKTIQKKTFSEKKPF